MTPDDRKLLDALLVERGREQQHEKEKKATRVDAMGDGNHSPTAMDERADYNAPTWGGYPLTWGDEG